MGMLIIKGEKKYEREEKEKGQYRMERSYGSFERAIELPSEVDKSKAKAEFKKGVLRLTLPKRFRSTIAEEENPCYVNEELSSRAERSEVERTRGPGVG